MNPAAGPQAEPVRAGNLRRVFRNASLLVMAQVVSAPLSLLFNAIAARRLGADDFGRVFLAGTLASLSFLLVEWGQPAILTSVVATQRPRAGEWLGSGIAWRLGGAVLALALTPLACHLLGYAPELREAVWISLAACVFGTVAGACQDALRGYERTDFGAASLVAAQLLGLLIVVPTLLLGGHLRAFLLAQTAATALGMALVLACLRPLGVPRLQVRLEAMKELAARGTPFLLFNLVLALQGNVDAVFLSRLASADAVGWFATARKLAGVLIFPANALTVALFPSLSRLHAEHPEEVPHATAQVLRWSLIAAMPIALGCGLFPQVGIALFGGDSYARAAEDLRVLAAYLLLLYLTMPLSSALMATGQRSRWIVVQSLCVAASLVLDPLLIPWFQQHGGNGGIGVCVSTLFSEAMMLAAALWLTGRRMFDRELVRTLAAAAIAGAAMAAAARGLAGVSFWLGAAGSLAVYAVATLALAPLSGLRISGLRHLLRR